MNFVKLNVENAAKSAEFYMKAFGLHERGRNSPTEIFVALNDEPVATPIVINQRPASATIEGPSTLSFVVEDMTAAMARATAAGGKVSIAPRVITVPGLTLDQAQIDDPDGNHIQLMHYIAMTPPK